MLMSGLTQKHGHHIGVVTWASFFVNCTLAMLDAAFDRAGVAELSGVLATEQHPVAAGHPRLQCFG